MSLDSLVRFFRNSLSPAQPESPQDHEQTIRVATAAILLETAYADSSLSASEETRILEFLQQKFDVSEAMARELVEAAEEMRSSTIDHWGVTSTVRKNFPLADRIQIVKAMWRLVYLDGDLHQYENYMVRKMADLLGLEHHVMIEAKMAVRNELSLASED